MLATDPLSRGRCRQLHFARHLGHDLAVVVVPGVEVALEEVEPWPAEAAEKYTDCAGRALGGEVAAALLQSLRSMSGLADVRALVRSTMAPGRAARPAAA